MGKQLSITFTEFLSAIGVDCSHKKVTDISYTDNLPAITGDSSKFYQGYCEHCQKMVYGRTGRLTIKWNYDRNKTFSDINLRNN